MDGTEYADDLGQSIPFDEFYQRIADGAEPTTSQVNVQQYIEFFESFLKEGKDILHIVFSSGLSGSYNSACIARDTLSEQYPDNKIYLVDSLAASSGYGLLVDTAADMRDSGKSAEEIVAWLEENKLNLHHWFFSTDLTSYIRGGRVSPVAVTPSTRPPLVTSFPSVRAVPAWYTTAGLPEICPSVRPVISLPFS